MSSLEISFVTLAVVFGGALLGIALRAVLPQQHLAGDSRDVVKLGMGLIATMAALVLGLLIASAKSSFDTQNAELTELASKAVLLDRILAHYGPEANEARELLRGSVASVLDIVSSRGADSAVPICNVHQRRSPLRQGPGALAERRCAAFDSGPSGEYFDVHGTNPLVARCTKEQFGFRTDARRAGCLACDYFHQLWFVRPSQSDCDSQFVGLRSFGFRRGLLNLGNVLPLCRTDPRLRRPNPRRPRTPGPVVTSRKESWPRRRASRLILHAASGPFRLGVL